MRTLPALEGLIAAIPCFLLAGTLLLTWVDPMSIDSGRWVRFGVGIMVLEFVLVHSGAMMASMERTDSWKQNLKIGLSAFAFYSLFAGGMALAFQSWTLFIIYSMVMLTRWVSILTRPASAKLEAQRRSGIAACFYLLAVFLSVMVPWPELGVTSSVINEVYPDRGGGEWERHPETALAAGVVYFTLVGACELVLGFNPKKAADQESPSA